MATQPISNSALGSQTVAVAGLWWKSLGGLLMLAGILTSFLVLGPAPGFSMAGEGAKLFLFHMPCAWLATLGFVLAACYSAEYLRRLNPNYSNPWKWLTITETVLLILGALSVLKTALKDVTNIYPWIALVVLFGVAINLKAMRSARELSATRPLEEYDRKAELAMELTFLFSFLTTVTGSIFSNNEWGAYWSWDPRQTTIVIILLICAAYGVLRNVVTDARAKARLGAVYCLVSLVPSIFMLFIVPRIVPTLHENANQAVLGGQIGGYYKTVLYLMLMPAFLILFVWMFQIGFRMKTLTIRARGGRA